MFLLANLIEVNIFALKEEVCMSNIKSLANKGRRRPPSHQDGSWWQWCGVCSTHWALLVGFAVTSMMVLLPGFFVMRCWVPPFRISGKTAGWIWAHLIHFCLVPHDSACVHLTSLPAPAVCQLNLFFIPPDIKEERGPAGGSSGLQWLGFGHKFSDPAWGKADGGASSLSGHI